MILYDIIQKLKHVVLELLSALWQKFVSWLKKGLEKIKQIVNNMIQGAQVFLEKVDNMFRRISKYYSETDEGKWRVDTVVTKKLISFDDVPDDIKLKAKRVVEGGTIDISQDVDNTLTLANR